MKTATEVNKNFSKKKVKVPCSKYKAIIGLSSVALLTFTSERVK
ncbi:hypothetical protein NBG4_830006 [Candidatus Sulfobium mesophilum]|uniref:Uncharacterized protein n=1 Tax=Candidatus Sulfobium mesophilum TaxID=2016548 RepID=A0A2U3QKP7_9BACT|nr:hypothetical protein NBG4_830006 [Candidatus Sulfobium mesophilum]